MASNGIENLAGQLALALSESESIQNVEDARELARALAIIQMGVADELSAKLSEWTLKNGPVAIDTAGDQAYGQWEKRTTMVGDENALWVFLREHGKDPDNYKRADMTVVKALLNEEEMLEGIETLVGTDTSYNFGFKRNLLKRPRAFAKPLGDTQKGEKVEYRLGPKGVVNRAKVVLYTPKTMVPAAETAPSCSVMPPVRVNA